jgi:hypothetical protein
MAQDCPHDGGVGPPAAHLDFNLLITLSGACPSWPGWAHPTMHWQAATARTTATSRCTRRMANQVQEGRGDAGTYLFALLVPGTLSWVPAVGKGSPVVRVDNDSNKLNNRVCSGVSTIRAQERVTRVVERMPVEVTPALRVNSGCPSRVEKLEVEPAVTRGRRDGRAGLLSG